MFARDMAASLYLSRILCKEVHNDKKQQTFLRERLCIFCALCGFHLSVL